jgi:deazaflavin-dependent oxidoreductase (nitroreductase family)
VTSESMQKKAGPPRGALVFMKPMIRVFNPIIALISGRRHFPLVATLVHRGRRSGREYRTPVGARIIGDRVWIPLSFGTRSDWCRNVLAAGGCEVHWKGVRHGAYGPRVVGRAEARAAIAAFPFVQRLTLRLIRLDAFMTLELEGGTRGHAAA